MRATVYKFQKLHSSHNFPTFTKLMYKESHTTDEKMQLFDL